MSPSRFRNATLQVFGLPHCHRRDCVMFFSNTLADTDAKGWRFCDMCRRSLAAALARHEP